MLKSAKNLSVLLLVSFLPICIEGVIPNGPEERQNSKREGDTAWAIGRTARVMTIYKHKQTGVPTKHPDSASFVPEMGRFILKTVTVEGENTAFRFDLPNNIQPSSISIVIVNIVEFGDYPIVRYLRRYGLQKTAPRPNLGEFLDALLTNGISGHLGFICPSNGATELEEFTLNPLMRYPQDENPTINKLLENWRDLYSTDRCIGPEVVIGNTPYLLVSGNLE